MRSKCARCNHSASFHDRDDGTCLALGCVCQSFVEQADEDEARSNLMALSRDRLRDVAKKNGVPIPKTKDQLVSRLVEAGVTGV